MEKAGDFLKQVFSASAANGVDKYLPLFRNWKSIIGSDLEKHVVLLDIQNDTLVTETIHPGWKQIVLLRKQAIFKRMNTYYPGLHIKNIRVHIVKKISRPSSSFTHSQQSLSQREEYQKPSPDIEEILSQMTDNELKNALKKLYASRPKHKADGSENKD